MINSDNAFEYVMRFEGDGLDEEETIELFQYLVDSELAWRLQGSYGRMASQLIEAGWVVASK